MIDPQSRFVGVLAAYRDLDTSVWRAVTPVTVDESNEIVVRLGRSAVSITGEGD